MTEEVKKELSEEPKEEKKCKCCAKDLKIFLLMIFGSFLGCLIALCLFSAAMKPKFPPPMPMYGRPPIQHMEHGKRFNHHRGDRPDFKGEKQWKKFDKDSKVTEPNPLDDDKD